MGAPLITGTTRYFDDPERPQVATGAHAGLKCDTSGPEPIILVCLIPNCSIADISSR